MVFHSRKHKHNPNTVHTHLQEAQSHDTRNDKIGTSVCSKKLHWSIIHIGKLRISTNATRDSKITNKIKAAFPGSSAQLSFVPVYVYVSTNFS